MTYPNTKTSPENSIFRVFITSMTTHFFLKDSMSCPFPFYIRAKLAWLRQPCKKYVHNFNKTKLLLLQPASIFILFVFQFYKHMKLLKEMSLAALWRMQLLPIIEAVRRLLSHFLGIQSKHLIHNSFQSMLLFFHSFVVLGIIITIHNSREKVSLDYEQHWKKKGLNSFDFTPAE